MSLTIATLMTSPHNIAKDDDNVLYRYTNKHGTKVLNSSVPSEYIAQGYEVINQSGQVIQVVPPTRILTEEEMKLEKENNELLNRYMALKRRYSSLDDIKSAKNRRLKSINNNISILKANLSGLKSRRQEHMSDAAKKERSQGSVPDYILKQIDDVDNEIKTTEKILNLRLEEYKTEEEKFDLAARAYEKGKAVEAQSKLLP